MEHHLVPFRKTKSFSQTFIDYIEQSSALKPFYNRFPVLKNFEGQIKEKQASFSSDHRNILVSVLKEQYASLKTTDLVTGNMEALGKENTFTVTTGHQLNIFTGPLYFIYKIVTVINACKQLKTTYPKYHFVPVYWMASEDHDFEEISYFKLGGKKYKWTTAQTGAVGRFNPKELESLIKEVPGDIELFKQAYLKHNTLSDAVRYYVDRLFNEQGLVVVDADHRELKKILRPVIKGDLFEHRAQEKVKSTDEALTKAGFAPQVHAREINFFYLDQHVRERLEKVDDHFEVVGADLKFTQGEIEELIANEPEKFSPNVILRPLYQEMILPNLAYVGGPAEVVYWLQLKSVFESFKVPFPMLMPRNFAMVFSGPMARKFEKAGLGLEELFEDKNFLFNDWVLKNTHHNLTLTNELKVVSERFNEIKTRAAEIDLTLAPMIAAEQKRASNSLEKIEKKLLRAEKRLHTDKLRQIGEVKDFLFPNGSLQERTDNFLNFYQQDKQFIDRILSVFDPFDYQFNVLRYPFT